MLSVYIKRTTAQEPFTFQDLIKLQDEVLARSERALLFAEVEPVVTLGTRQLHGQDPRQNDIEQFTQNLNQQGIAVLSGERGGNETWHGPGQWVCFPVMPLVEFVGDPKGVRKAVHQTLELLLPVIVAYVPSAHIELDDRLGIWSDVGKLVSIGIKIRQGPDRLAWMTSGFAINCFRTEKSFYGINPCGIGQAIPDFLFREKNFADPSLMNAEFNSLPSQISGLSGFRK